MHSTTTGSIICVPANTFTNTHARACMCRRRKSSQGWWSEVISVRQAAEAIELRHPVPCRSKKVMYTHTHTHKCTHTLLYIYMTLLLCATVVLTSFAFMPLLSHRHITSPLCHSLFIPLAGSRQQTQEAGLQDPSLDERPEPGRMQGPEHCAHSVSPISFPRA